MNINKHIWEGWTVGDFIESLHSPFHRLARREGLSKEDIKKWAMDNQPYYKKHIPEVVTYYWNEYKKNHKEVL